MGPGPVDTTNKADTGIGLPDHGKPEFCSSSSTSSDSSDDDFFQLDPVALNKPMQPSANEALQFPAQHKGGGSPTRSPQVQVMGRSDVPDPNRIPSSVFARTKSTTPMEWSVASNESLFSIHMGNSSFSRDHVFLMGSPMDGYAPSPTPPFSPVSAMPGSSLPPLSPARPVSMVEVQPAVHPVPAPAPAPAPRTTEEANAEAMKDVLQANAAEHNGSEKDKVPVDLTNGSARFSRQSDGSATSFRSFAFPILTSGEVRNGSIKVEAEHHPPQTPKTADQSEQQQTPNAGESPKTPPPPPTPPPAAPADAKGWLSCFSCCPFCR